MSKCLSALQAISSWSISRCLTAIRQEAGLPEERQLLSQDQFLLYGLMPCTATHCFVHFYLQLSLCGLHFTSRMSYGFVCGRLLLLWLNYMAKHEKTWTIGVQEFATRASVMPACDYAMRFAVWVLCRTSKFFHSKLPKPFLPYIYCWNRKGPFPNSLNLNCLNIILCFLT